MPDPLRPDERKRLERAVSELARAGSAWPALTPRPARARRRAPSLIDVELDPEQRRIVELDRSRSVLVTGEAGHGKTTVALHRVAHLYRTSPGPLRIAVVVPTEGLVRLVTPLLRRLGADVEATTYDEWAQRQARRAFRDVPRRESEDARPAVARLKRDPALRVALRELARQKPGFVDDDRDARPTRSRAHARRADLQRLFGDSELLAAVARASGDLTERMLEDVLDHTRVQFSKTTEVEYAHVVDRARLLAVDGRPLDQGTASGDAKTIDAEDYAVLFELDRMRAEVTGRAPTSPRAFDVLMLDEAQELAPLELALLGRSVAPGGSVIVAGDAAQQIDPSTTFHGWSEAMRELGVARYDDVELGVGYRCPPEVVAIAKQVLGAAPDDARHDGSALRPRFASFADEAQRAAWLAREIVRLVTKDPRASLAILCRTDIDARSVAKWVRPLAPVRWVTDGRFRARGAQITTIDQVKGLEFDYVVVADAGAEAFPDVPAARRALYVAATRARHEVVFLAIGRATPLLGDVA